MKLNEWVKRDAGRAASLARAIGVAPSLISQWGSGIRGIPLERCVPIERATDGAVTRKDLRPDDWAEIWPELALSAQNTAEPSAIRSLVAINAEAQEVANG